MTLLITLFQHVWRTCLLFMPCKKAVFDLFLEWRVRLLYKYPYIQKIYEDPQQIQLNNSKYKMYYLADKNRLSAFFQAENDPDFFQQLSNDCHSLFPKFTVDYEQLKQHNQQLLDLLARL